MKMLGVVKNYNKEENYGYIEAGDDVLYLFFKENINTLEELKVGNLVKFIPIYSNIHAAVEIEMIDNII